MLNGILIIRKERDYTSSDVVAKLRGICRQKKIGHTGTLDPNATGVLPVCLGNATKLCDMLTDRSKEYIAEFTLGLTTDTEDIWGKALTDSGEKWRELSEEEIEKAVLSFQGKQLQVPPMYSALKVNGKRLYELARAGKTVERAPREIEIEEIELLPPEGCPDTDRRACRAACFLALPKLRMRVVCSKGTYIRTLCRDIGDRLGCGAVMSGLVRTRVGGFLLENSHTLSEIEQIKEKEGLEGLLIPVDECFAEYPAAEVSGDGLRFLKNGNELKYSMVKGRKGDILPRGMAQGDGMRPECHGSDLNTGKSGGIGVPVRVYDAEGTFYGVYRLQQDGKTLKPWKMFLPG